MDAVSALCLLCVYGLMYTIPAPSPATNCSGEHVTVMDKWGFPRLITSTDIGEPAFEPPASLQAPPRHIQASDGLARQTRQCWEYVDDPAYKVHCNYEFRPAIREYKVRARIEGLQRMVSLLTWSRHLLNA